MSLNNFKVLHRREKSFWLTQPSRIGLVNPVDLVSQFLPVRSLSMLLHFPLIPASKWTKPIELKASSQMKKNKLKKYKQKTQEESAKTQPWLFQYSKKHSSATAIPICRWMNPCGTHWDRTFFFFLLYIEIKIEED